ncbi:MAG: hypothetical protein V1899_04525 [Planctomycetota bacterium]
MAEHNGSVHIFHAEIKAGVFLTFCLALFIVMLFGLSKFGHVWRGRQLIQVVFTHANALRSEAPVRYNGMEFGNVRSVTIVRLDADLLAKFPTLTRSHLPNLPLTEAEREKLRQGGDDQLDTAIRKIIGGRAMALLTLDVLTEGDTRRFRMDDEYRITGSLLGDSAVEVCTGSGTLIQAAHEQCFIGVSGDMYTDLGKSISQVKDILASMAETVGGNAQRQTIQEQLANFDKFTVRIDTTSGSLSEKLPQIWDRLDQRLGNAQATLTDIETKVVKLQPDIDQTLTNAQQSITDIQKDTDQSARELQEKVERYRQSAQTTIADWQKIMADYKDSLPAQIKAARELTDNFGPMLNKLDMALTRADDQLNKGIDSTRATLNEYIVIAGNLEETTYRLKRWPWSYAQQPDANILQVYDTQWRHDLARRQYLELRAELDRTRLSISQASAADRSHVARIEQLLRESETTFDVGKASTTHKPPTKKAK